MAFTAGETVKLKSGGPIMTVDSDESAIGGLVQCSWFVGTKRETGGFVAETLERVNPPKGGVGVVSRPTRR
jgi:uncharacterized protein YodC (DUF2158 family)